MYHLPNYRQHCFSFTWLQPLDDETLICCIDIEVDEVITSHPHNGLLQEQTNKNKRSGTCANMRTVDLASILHSDTCATCIYPSRGLHMRGWKGSYIC